MKRLIAILLAFVIFSMLFTGCGLPGNSDSDKDTESAASANSSHYLLHTVKDGSTTYYCWEDGVATMTDTYDGTSALFWENDVNKGIYYIKNSKSTVAMEQYIEPTEAPSETIPDPKQGHELSGIVTDPSTGKAYYCWDDGNASMSEEYAVTGLTWTHPWGQRFFNIYNGDSSNGNVIYSEKACSWCGNHKTFYYSLIRSSYDYSEEGVYLCESCHIDLTSYHVKCCKCGYYYYKDYAVLSNGYYYCEKCYCFE